MAEDSDNVGGYTCVWARDIQENSVPFPHFAVNLKVL